MRGVSRLLIALLFLASPVAGNEITWLTMRFPPFYIHGGEQKGQGIADRITAMLTRHLGDYSHREEAADPATIMARMKSGDRVCTAAYIRTPEREKVLHYSLPALILPPNSAIVRRESLPSFGGGGPVSLARLLANRQLKAAVAVGRSYGPALDVLLEPHKSSAHVYWRRGEDIFPGLFEMLTKGSVDYVIGYPYEALYLSTQRGLGDRVVSVPFSESPDYTLAHVVCPKNEWGRQVITAVDRALRVERQRPEYRQAIERWLEPAQQDEFRRQYEQRFLTSR